MKTKTMLSALCAAALVFSSFSPMSITASGESEVVFDASTFESFKDRTAQQVADEYAKARYAGETYVNSDSSSYYSTPASTSAPYNAGVLTDDTHKAMTEMANFHRWLAGEYPLKVSSTHSDKLQAEALDRNFEWGHVQRVEQARGYGRRAVAARLVVYPQYPRRGLHAAGRDNRLDKRGL